MPTEHPSTAVKRRPGTGTRETRRSLAESWQGEAQECQTMMDGLKRELDLGVSTRDRFDCGWYYWRGRRDAFETAAFEMFVALGDFRPSSHW